MPLKEQLADDLKDAMRAGDALRRDVIRSVLTAIGRAERPPSDDPDTFIPRRELSDGEVLDVVQQQAKQRRDSAFAFQKAGRTDLYDTETAELGVLDSYLPQQMSRDEVMAEVRAVIAETGASGPADKAKVMPTAIARTKGKADGRVVNEVVTELLGK